MKALFALLIFCALLSSCKKNVPNGNIMPPNATFVLLDKQGNNLLTSTSTPISIWFIQDGQRKYVGSECSSGSCTMVREAHSSTGTPLKYKYYYMSLGMSLVSSEDYKTFYMELGGKTDTLFWDVQKTKPNDPLDKYDIVSVKFNGKPVVIDQDQLPIYPLQRLH